MRKLILTALFGFVLSGCSSSDSTPTTTDTNFKPGIYTGQFDNGTITDSYIILVTSTDAWAGADPFEASTGIVTGDTITNSAGFSATLTSSNAGTYLSPPSVTGTFNLVDTGLYNRSSSLTKLTGTWVDNVFTDVTGVTTWTIQANGSFNMTSVSGCSATGTIGTLDTGKNEYTMSATVSNCGVFNGAYSGFGFTQDANTFSDNQFSFVIDNADNFAVFSPVKQ